MRKSDKYKMLLRTVMVLGSFSYGICGQKPIKNIGAKSYRVGENNDANSENEFVMWVLMMYNDCRLISIYNVITISNS